MDRERDRGWDVFLSYARVDAEPAAVLTRLLRGHGLSVFVDEADTSGFSSLDAQLRAALAASKVLVAFYSATYPRRPSCQFELTAAFVSGQRDGDPRSRIAVVNPESNPDHIVPSGLRDVRHSRWPFDAEEAERFPTAIAERVRTLSTRIGAVPNQVPGFEGRYRELWRLHSELTRPPRPLTTVSGPRTCMVTGVPGIGKTALARQYAALFGSAFADGVRWGDLIDPSGPADGLTVLEVPPGTSAQRVTQWLSGRPATAASLILAEDRLNLSCDVVTLTGLDDSTALKMLSRSQPSPAGTELEQARLLVAELGGHPQAVLSAAAMVRAAAVVAPYDRVRRSWLSGHIGGGETRLPDGYRADPLPSLRNKLARLDTDSLDVVRALSVLPPRFCRPSTLETLWMKIGGVEPLLGVLESVARQNLCEHCDDGTWRLNPLLRLLASRLETDPARRALVEQAAWLSVSDYPKGADLVGGAMTASTLSQAEQEAAFRLQVDLSSRITTVPLADEDGFLREALTSMREVLGTARDVLGSLAATRRGTAVVSVAREVIDEIRPLLSRWHPLLAEHESLRPSDVGVRTHEHNWEHNAQLRRELAGLQERLRGIETRLEDLTGTRLSL